jgi:nucleolar GTP-binding protein
MNFQNLRKVEKAHVYLDVAFRSARTRQKPSKVSKKENLAKTREYIKVEAVAGSIDKQLGKILSSYPDISELPEFYLELVRITLDYPTLKKSLGAVSWAQKRAKQLSSESRLRIKKSKSAAEAANARNQFYGRVASIVKQIDRELQYLEHARITMKGYPAIKTGRYTVAIAGFPNVGKSSVLKALTGANPKIRDYSFTTQSLNFGYMDKIQVIDTPGTLNRSKMNIIEQQAKLALRLVADLIVFLIDETGEVDLKQQKKLLERCKALRKAVVIAYSKSDRLKDRRRGRLYVSARTGEGLDKLARLIKDHEANSKREDDKD